MVDNIVTKRIQKPISFKLIGNLFAELISEMLTTFLIEFLDCLWPNSQEPTIISKFKMME